jgi:hypothetical protein
MPRGYPLSEAVGDGIWELRAKGLSDRESVAASSSPGDCEQPSEVGRGYSARGSPAPGALPELGGARGDLAGDRPWSVGPRDRSRARSLAYDGRS